MDASADVAMVDDAPAQPMFAPPAQTQTKSQTFNVKLPDGTIVNGIPVGTTKDQIKAKLEAKGYKLDDAKPEAKQSKGFFGREGEDLSKRASQISEAGAAYKSGDKSMGRAALDIAGAYGGGIGDTVGNAVGSMARGARDLVTDPTTIIGLPTDSGQQAQKQIGDAARQAGDWLMAPGSNPAAPSFGDLARYAGKQIGDVQKSYPDTTAVIGDVANIVSAIPAAKGIAGAVEGAGKAAIDVGANAIKPIKNLGSGIADAKDVARLGLNARDADALQESAQALKAKADASYADMRSKGAVLSQESANKVVSNIEGALDKTGVVDSDFHPQTVKALEKLKSAIEASPDGVGLDTLDKYRQLFSDAVLNGKGNADAFKAKAAVKALNDSVGELGADDLISGDRTAIDSLNSGKQQWGQYKKFSTVAKVVSDAGGDPNKLKSGLQRLANNPRKTTGWSPEEIKALRNGANNTTGEKLLKMFGKFGLDLGSNFSPGNTALPAAELYLGGPKGGAGAVIGGTFARIGQKAIASGKGENLLQTIEGKPTLKTRIKK